MVAKNVKKVKMVTPFSLPLSGPVIETVAFFGPGRPKVPSTISAESCRASGLELSRIQSRGRVESVKLSHFWVPGRPRVPPTISAESCRISRLIPAFNPVAAWNEKLLHAQAMPPCQCPLASIFEFWHRLGTLCELRVFAR